MANVNISEVAASIVSKLMNLGFTQLEAYALRDSVIRTQKSLTNLGSITAGTPLPNAVDSKGNLLLKNIQQVIGVTSNPTVNSIAFVTIPEMTQTFTVKGKPVLLLFTGGFQFGVSVSGSDNGFMQFYRDGVSIGPQWFEAQQFSANPPVFTMTLAFLDQPSAGQHTYEARYAYFNAGSGSSFKAIGTDRTFQAVELG